MKKVLFISNFNPEMKEVDKNLMDFFQVQICLATVDSVKEMLTMYDPDAVLISLKGFERSEKGIFELFADRVNNIPVVTTGTESESCICQQYYDEEIFVKMVQPLKDEDIILKLGDLLGMDVEKEVESVLNSKDQRKHILCVDDSGITLRQLREIIPIDYRVSVVNSGIKMLSMIERDRPDLIFLDYDMPVVDGKQTLEMLRGEESYEDIPVVFITGKNDIASIQSVLSLNPAGYLLKPPSREQITAKIREIIGR